MKRCVNAESHSTCRLPARATLKQRVAWHRAHREDRGCRPGPPRRRQAADSAAAGERTAEPPDWELRVLLAGGDRRSIAASKRAQELVERQPTRMAALAALATDADWLISMRALDLLEKFAQRHPEWVRPHKQLFIGSLADSDKWEIHLQIVRALPLFRWSARQRERVLGILRRDLDHRQMFVCAWALDSLATLAERDSALRREVGRALTAFERSGSKALATRAHHIRDRLAQRPSPIRPVRTRRPRTMGQL